MSLAQELLGKIKQLQEESLAGIGNCTSAEELEKHYHTYLGKKGELTSLLKDLKGLSGGERKEAGMAANRLRSLLEEAHRKARADLELRLVEERIANERFDALRPLPDMHGHLHPITQIQMEVEEIFTAMGFQIMDGPEVESDKNNFGKLNFSDDHPARDMQDTIWTTDGNLLRTHTSSVQVRSMERLTPPFRIIAPGRVFRYEELDASHENTFHQVEGMMVGKDISVANLIHIMKTFLSRIFGEEIKVRLRPGYFPFVEPGFELDSQCLICSGKGCRTCKQSGWIELLPCGLVHPEVLRAGNIDPKQWNGFAFGLGLDRLVMLRHNIEDIRHFMSGNLRFLQQF